MNVLEDLSRGQPYLGSILEIPLRQLFVYVKGVGEDELDGDHETFSYQNKQPQPDSWMSVWARIFRW
jgi:hypothetical protein